MKKIGLLVLMGIPGLSQLPTPNNDVFEAKAQITLVNLKLEIMTMQATISRIEAYLATKCKEKNGKLDKDQRTGEHTCLVEEKKEEKKK